MFKTLLKKEKIIILIIMIILGILLYLASETDFIMIIFEILFHWAFETDFIIISFSFILFSIFFVSIKEKKIKKFLISLSALMLIFINILEFSIHEWWWYKLQMTHLFLIFAAILTLLVYIFKNKNLWWIIFFPSLPTIIMYFLEEFYPCLKPVGLGAV